MAYRPLAYAGQYPPPTPRSPADVASYALLHTSLRALPELSKEGDKILNEEMLARLVDGVRRFQRDQLGRNSKSKYWPTVRLPDPLFSDRASYPNGPLSVAILSAFRIKRSAPWRNFNFDNPKLFDDNIAIIRKMEQDLTDRGFLKRPVIYFDASVEEGLGRNEVHRLSKIAQRFGAKVVDDPKEVAHGRVSHIVAYDPEEHDTREVRDEEERREQAGEEAEKTYLKTLAIVDVPIEELEPGNASGTTRKMALVHWWYHPSSYDEWMAAEEVAGEVEADEHPGIPGGPAVVGCKFVRDVERFNEWGMEADYAVMEYERKIAYLRKEPTKAASSSKKSKRRSDRAAARKESAEELDAASDGEPASKRSKLEGGLLGEAPPSPSRKAKSSKSSKAGSPSSKAVVAAIHKPTRQTADRRKPEGRQGGMNPRRILTGFRGPRGEIDRRVVYDGALRVENEPYGVVRDALEDYLLGNGEADNKATPPNLSARQEWRKLLPPTGFVRPSADTTLKSVTVTELTLKEVEVTVPPVDGIGEPTTELRDATVAVHVSVPVLTPQEEEAVGGAEGPASIRGGGEEEEAGAAAPEQAAAPAPVADAPAIAAEASMGGGEIAPQLQAAVEPVVAAAVEPVVEAGAPTAFSASAADEDVAAQPSASEGVTKAPDALEGDVETSGVVATSEGTTMEAVQPSVEVEAAQQPGLNLVGPTGGELPTQDAPGASTGMGMQPMDEDPPAVAPFESANNAFEEPAPPVAGEVTQTQGEGAPVAVDAALPHDTEAMTIDTRAADERNTSSEMQIESAAPEFVAPGSMVPDAVAPPAGDQIDLTASEEQPVVAPEMPGAAPAEGQDPAPMAPATGDSVNVEEIAMAATETPDTEPASTTPAPADGIASVEAVADAPPGTMATGAPVPTEAVQATSANANVEEAASKPKEAPAPEVSMVASVATPAEAKVASAAKLAEPSNIASSAAQPTVEQPNSQPESTAIASSGVIQREGQVVPLPSGTQLSTSLYRAVPPSSTEEAKSAEVVRPSWYDSEPSDFEKRMLPEWFNNTAPHRTPTSYIDAREKILDIAKRNGGQYITSTAIRRSVLGDAGSLLRLHEFLVGQGLLNSDRVGETTPSDTVLRGLGATRKPKKMRLQAEWTTARMQALETSVIRHVSKKKAEAQPDQGTQMIVDWAAVAADIGGGVTAADCQRAFIEPPSEQSRLAADASKGSVKSMLSGILDGVRPEVLKATVEAALRSTQDVTEARKACFVALTAISAAGEGARAEAEVENTLMDILDQRVQRLENRVALLDDVEALLEAERVSLELERRDMYTTRCRHWFG